MIFFDSGSILISIPPDKTYVHSCWKGDYTYEEAVDGFAQAAAAIRLSARSLYLSDVSRASPPCERTLEYALNTGFVLMADAGLCKIGSVFPLDSFSQLIADQVLNLPLPLEYRMFGTLEEAEKWLIEK